MKHKPTKDLLITIMNNKSDFIIAQNEQWYRIPVESAPVMVRDNSITHIAFYQTKIFKEDAFKIQWHGAVKKISIVKRKELFPESQLDPKAEKEYYKIKFGKLKKLPQPVFSRRHRRILFITTTMERFEAAIELNDVFKETPIEEKFWEVLKGEEIDAERQYMIQTGEKFFLLDFAIFSKKRDIDVECNGDKYHSEKKDVKRDKQRDNILESKGWAVLRYTIDQINKNIGHCIRQVKETINRYGGLQNLVDESKSKYFDTDKTDQIQLFD